ncbi:CatB-related O-acetyltransferase [Clostridium culturomicium]|uniref:CatB-related O-acetyltransferase n=1 Tax=Clostridium culturomicium TaxID=1499683 RepID=UPI00385722EC
MGRLVKQIKSIYRNLFVYKKNSIRISLLAYCDDECKFSSNVYVDRLCNLHNTTMDSYSYIGYGSSVTNCKIGKFCSISSDVKIGLGTHPINLKSTSPVFYNNNNCLGTQWSKNNEVEEFGSTTIGNDVWIGTNAIVMADVKIGDGAVIGAGSIVTKDVPPYAIVVGVPAKVIKYRFEEEQIEKLLEEQWWNMNEEEIINRINEFSIILEDYTKAV